MNELKKIAYNCRKATFLIEKQQIGRITFREKLELRIHLVGCSICKTFQQQSIMINKMVHNFFHSAGQTERKLDEKFKQDLQKSIDDKLR